ncbi:MAG: ATP synthase F0 subunit B, partial [Actinomycetes bacterium]
MRTRTLLASLLLAVVGLLALAPAASAQGPEGGEELSEDTKECIEQAEAADDPEACQESPNLILPATDELVWGSISFLVLLFLLYKFAYPQVKQGMDARTERIRAELQAADAAKSDAEGVLE